jgi:hypothetical protein
MLRRLAAVGLLAFGGVASAADALATFTDATGCNLYSSPDGVRRLREIASQGRVLWEGACRNGFIDGPGILRHEGLVEENGRKRRYAFFLTGVARAGMREGTWIRETFNMFTDSQRYWTSLAVLRYSGSIARGSPQMREVRGNADFSAAFRRFLAEADRELAQRASAGAPSFAEAAAPPPPPLEPAEPTAPAAPPVIAGAAPAASASSTATAATTGQAAPSPMNTGAPASIPSAPAAPVETPAPARVASPAPAASPPAPATSSSAPPPSPPPTPAPAVAVAPEARKPTVIAGTEAASPTAAASRPVTATPPSAATAQAPMPAAPAVAAAPAQSSPPPADPRTASASATTPSRVSPAAKPAASEGSLRSSQTLASVSREEPRPDPPAGAGRFSGSLSLSGGGGLRPSGGMGMRPREPVIATGPKLLEQIHGCFMDTINGTLATEPVVAKRGAPLRVAGWAVDPENKRVPEKAWLRIASAGREGGLTAAISRNVNRPDVGKALGDPVFDASGFNVAIPTTALEPGDYIIGIIQQSDDVMLICQSMGRLSLR